MRGCLLVSVIRVLLTILCMGCWRGVTPIRRENRCMRHYFVETIRHPSKDCEQRNVLLARCEGHCNKSKTLPRVSFSPILYRPFKYSCSCCRDNLSIMKAVSLKCKNRERVFATYRYILKCSCEYCGYGNGYG